MVVTLQKRIGEDIEYTREYERFGETLWHNQERCELEPIAIASTCFWLKKMEVI